MEGLAEVEPVSEEEWEKFSDKEYEAYHKRAKGAFSLVNTLVRVAPQQVIPAVWNPLLRKLDTEDKNILGYVFSALWTAFDATARYIAHSLRTIRKQYASPEMDQRVKAVCALQELLEATPWYLDRKWVDKVKWVMRYFDDRYKYRELKESAFDFAKEIVEWTERWCVLLSPFLLQILQESEKAVLEQGLKLVRYVLEGFSFFLRPFSGYRVRYSEFERGWVENIWFKETYKAVLQEIPKRLDQAAVERLSELFSALDREVQAMALYLSELVLTYTPANITPAFVTNLEALSAQAELIFQPMILALYQQLAEQRPELLSPAMVDYAYTLLGAEGGFGEGSEEMEQEGKAAIREIFSFMDHEGNWRDNLNWFGAYWYARLSAIDTLYGIFEKAPELITQDVVALVLACLEHPVKPIREVAFAFYEKAREVFSHLVSRESLQDLPLLSQLTCPKCGAQIVAGMVEGIIMPRRFDGKSWARHSMEELLGLAVLICESCRQTTPLREFPADVQDFWVTVELAPAKKYHETRWTQMQEIKVVIINKERYNRFLREPLQRGYSWDFKFCWAALLQNPHDFGVDLYCQACGGKIAFGPKSSFGSIEWDAVIECSHCGMYIKLVLPEGMQMPGAPKDLAFHF